MYKTADCKINKFPPIYGHSSLAAATLIKIEGANHGFDAGKPDKEMLVAFTNEWIEQLINRKSS